MSLNRSSLKKSMIVIPRPSHSFCSVETVVLLLRPPTTLFTVDCVTPLIVLSLLIVRSRSAHNCYIRSLTASPIVILLVSSQEPIHRNLQNICQRVQLNIRHGPLLTFQQRQRRCADFNSGSLQFGQQLVLLHTQREPRLCDAGTDYITISSWEFPSFHIITPMHTKYMCIGACYIW